MERSSTIIACGIGGAVCTLAALLFTPAYWWLGLFAGFSAGYISGDFREVVEAVPLALSRAWDKTDVRLRTTATAVKRWLKEPHEVIYSGLVAGAPLAAYAFSLLHAEIQRGILTGEFTNMGQARKVYVFTVLISGAVIFCVTTLQMTLAYIGARHWEKCFFSLEPDSSGEQLINKGLREKPLTYRNYWRWAGEGTLLVGGYSMKFVFWTVWKEGGCFFGRFIYNLFVIIHSEKRLMWGVDSALGGGTAYLWLAASVETSLEQAMLICFGGILGAAFGALNRELFVVRRQLQPVKWR